MAELTIVGWVVSPLIQKLTGKVLSYAKDQYKWLKGPSTESLEHLACSLTRIHAAAGAVERFQYQNNTKDPRHSAWLQQLKDAVYEIDDILDEFSYYTLKAGSQPKGSRCLLDSGRTVKRIFGMDQSINRLKRLLQRLDAMEDSYKSLVGVATLQALGSSLVANPACTAGSSGPLLIGSVPTEDEMIGRDAERQALVSRLITSRQRNGNFVPVVAIVGRSGMGKTTLAQFVFNDYEVQKCFDMMMWVSVPERFGEIDLISEIINSVENEMRVGTINFPGLQQVLIKMVRFKKFLLVLDNVHYGDNETPHVAEIWKNVLAPFRYANKDASRILVTTQMMSMNKIFDSIEYLRLKKLEDIDEWSVLKMFALGDKNFKTNEEIEKIGRQIAHKLKGSPLAAKVVGGMLRAKPTREFWEEILSNKDIYNNSISTTVKTSFAKLPEHLQRCFAYCSIFPRNWEFDRKTLVKMWIAHDFIEPREGEDKDLEDLGLECFNELKRNSFFDYRNPGRRTYYVIHDTVYDAALSASTTECMRYESNQSKNVPPAVRHLSVSTDRLLQLQNQCKLKRLRTLVVLNVKNNSHSLDTIDEVLIQELSSLRVLDISNTDVTVLSEKVGQMKHLRYLALCRTINVLPQSIVDLHHLQTLYIPRECKIEKLPNGINKLINMRHLDVDPRCIAEISSIGGMVNLNCSLEFHVKTDDGHKLEELRNMDKINGKLAIKNLENVADGHESSKANLKKKKWVKVLTLEWSAGAGTNFVDIEVLENLEPHPNLQELCIMRYFGNKSPQWLQQGELQNLKNIYLINCRKWVVLPPLGHLPALKILYLKEMSSVEEVGPDFYGISENAFPNLQELEFNDMPQWIEWFPGVNISAFPKLKKITLCDCPKLDKVPPIPVTVKTINAKRNGFVSYLKMRPYHTTKPNKLFIETSSLKIFDELLSHKHLAYTQALTIYQCKESVNIAAGYKGALASVKKLRICQSGFVDDELKKVLQEMKDLVTLEIIDCPRIENLHLTGVNKKLEEFHVENCKLFSSLSSLQNSPFLKIMMVVRCPKFTLTSLPSDLKALSSLKKFSVHHCPEFKSLPEKGFPQSLEWFELIGCGQYLTKSLYETEGSDWGKISHVLNVLVRY